MSGKWARSIDFTYTEYPLTELSSKTLGLIGFGNIGKRVYEIACAFGMNVVAFTPEEGESQRKNFRWVQLNELLKESDVVSLHCPLTPETEGLINSERLSMMKTSAFLINTARGPIVVDRDLADALNNGIIAGAGLDVLSGEPPSENNPMLHARNCIITPHIAWATVEARSRLMKIAVENVRAFLSGSPVNVVS
jgi:glycerate dehydrogenase